MSEFVFPPPSRAAAPIRGRAERFPIRRIFCVGRNYEAHAKEMGVAADREAPFYFTKAAEHYAPSGSTITYPPGTSNYHYEMEFVVAIGKAGFRIAEAQALDHVFGYACGLDMTRRDLQSAAKEKQRPWDIGKDVEQSAGTRRHRAGGRHRPPRSRPHRAACQRPAEAVGRHIAADSRRPCRHRAPVAVLSFAAGRSRLHRHARGRGCGEARRSARGVD